MQLGFLGSILSGVSPALTAVDNGSNQGQGAVFSSENNLNSDANPLFKNDFLSLFNNELVLPEELGNGSGPLLLDNYPALKASLVNYIEQQLGGKVLPQAGGVSPLNSAQDAADLEQLLQGLPKETFAQLEQFLTSANEGSAGDALLLLANSSESGVLAISASELAKTLLGIADALTQKISGYSIGIDSDAAIEASTLLETAGDQTSLALDAQRDKALSTQAIQEPLDALVLSSVLPNQLDQQGIQNQQTQQLVSAERVSVIQPANIESLLRQIEQLIQAKNSSSPNHSPPTGQNNLLANTVIPLNAHGQNPLAQPMQLDAGLKANPLTADFAGLLASSANISNNSAALPAIDINAITSHSTLTHLEPRAASVFNTEIQTPLLPQLPSNVLTNQQWNQQFQQRIAWITTQGIAAADIQLNPPELGPLSMRVDTHHEQASVVFTSHSPAAREAIEANLPRLRELFAAQGLDLLDVDIAEQQSEQSAANHFAQENSDSDADEMASVQDHDGDLPTESLSSVSVITLNYAVDTYI